MTTLERFLVKIALPAKLSDCWEFTGGLDAFGYGRFWYNKMQFPAHKYSYQHFIGPVPEGMNICHTCDNPKCVSPKHLFAGTQKDNMQDMVKKQRHNTRPGGLASRKNTLPEGVTKVGNKFQVQKKRRYVGIYPTVGQAIEAFKRA